MDTQQLESLDSQTRHNMELAYNSLATANTIAGASAGLQRLQDAKDDLADIEAMKSNPMARTRLVVKRDLGRLRAIANNLQQYGLAQPEQSKVELDKVKLEIWDLEQELEDLNRMMGTI